MEKKLWQIAGTKEFSNNKAELKKVRFDLNKDSGIDEKKDNSNTWKFRITKGPDHVDYKSRF